MIDLFNFAINELLLEVGVPIDKLDLNLSRASMSSIGIIILT
jgi:hypothetical protein